MTDDTITPIVIVGGGLAGLMMALTLAQQGQSVVVLDRGDGGDSARNTKNSVRTTTLNPRAMAHLESLGVLPLLKKNKPVPITAITVSDTKQHKQRTPIKHNANDRLIGWENDNALAYTIRNDALMAAISKIISSHPSITCFRGVAISSFNPVSSVFGHAAASIEDDTGKVFHARLIIACDGAVSELRKLAGIRTITRNPEQTAITADIRLERPHQHTAWQRFIDNGPVALMPLADAHESSLVWTVSNTDAEELMAASDADFNDRLNAAAMPPFGRLDVISPRASWPLHLHHAIWPVGTRLALAGDAAHSIHPLAGQGFNLGIGDMKALADCLEWAAQTGSDIGCDSVLSRYAKKRFCETALMTIATDGLNALFSSAPPPLRAATGIAMMMLDRTGLKNLAMKIASNET